MTDSDLPLITPQPRSGWNGAWYPAPVTLDSLEQIVPGTGITIVKWRPDGTEAARYPGTVIESHAPAPWNEVQAIWTNRAVDVAGLTFEPGDVLREFFSPVHPFNAFAVVTPGGIPKGWYGNVTYPAFLLDAGPEPTLVWHDLYLDAVVLADGTVHLLDDEELDVAPTPFSEPGMHRAIHTAREDLIAFIRSLNQVL